MNIEKVNLKEKLSLFNDYWNPRIVGELNRQHLKLVKMKGEFIWHKHDGEDELFFVIDGKLKIEFRERSIELEKGELIIITKGTEHRPSAEEEASVMLLEPVTTLNTGDKRNEFTRDVLKSV